MPKPMTVSMIEMYANMVTEKFEPIVTTLKVRQNDLEEQCRIEAKKELGIYEKLLTKARLKLELEQLNEQLTRYTENRSTVKGYINKIELLTAQKMEIAKNGVYKKVQKARDEMIFKIKLSGIEGDTKEVFQNLPGIIESLVKEVKKLPPLPVKGPVLIKS